MRSFRIHRNSDNDIINKLCVLDGFKSRVNLENACFCSVQIFLFPCKGKGKAVPLHAWTGPEGSMKLRLPDFVTTAQDGCRPYAPTAFTPRKYSWYSFLLEAESTPEP